MADKAPEAFRTISEVSDLLDTPPHVLRFWESKFAQLKPVKRAGGRRYYRPADVALLAGIRRLLHDDGMTIRGVQKLLREHGVRHVAELGAAPDGAIEAEAREVVAEEAPAPDLFAGLDVADAESLLPEAEGPVAPLPAAPVAAEAEADGRQVSTRLRGLEAVAEPAAWQALEGRVAALHARLVAADRRAGG